MRARTRAFVASRALSVSQSLEWLHEFDSNRLRRATTAPAAATAPSLKPLLNSSCRTETAPLRDDSLQIGANWSWQAARASTRAGHYSLAYVCSMRMCVFVCVRVCARACLLALASWKRSTLAFITHRRSRRHARTHARLHDKWRRRFVRFACSLAGHSIISPSRRRHYQRQGRAKRCRFIAAAAAIDAKELVSSQGQLRTQEEESALRRLMKRQSALHHAPRLQTSPC